VEPGLVAVTMVFSKIFILRGFPLSVRENRAQKEGPVITGKRLIRR
jgi:hypothetical protein